MSIISLMSMATDVARDRGSDRGVLGTIYDVGDALGPIVAGFLVAAAGYTRMFQIMAAVALTMAVAFGVASGTAAAGRAAPRT